MFHIRTGQIVAILFPFAMMVQPMMVQAAESSTPVVQAQAVESNASKLKAYFPQEHHFDELRHEARAKISDTRQWVKDHPAQQTYNTFIDDLGQATDRLQDRVTPAGRSLKKSLKNTFQGTNLVHQTDRTVTIYGLMLILAFAFVFFLMSLANPISRLGGRH